MPRRRRSIYIKLYSWFSGVALLFFAHNALRHYSLDVLHLNQTVTFKVFGWGTSFLVKDPFLFYDAGPGDSMDVQVYVYRLSTKLALFILTLAAVETLRVLNMFLAEMPGRSCYNLIAFTSCFTGLFAYETLDFILACAQSSWVVEAVVFLMFVGTAILTVKDK